MTAAPTPEHASSEIDLLSPDRLLTIVDAIPTIGKLATLAALDQTPDDFVSSRDMSLRLDTMQGANPAIRFRKDSPRTAYNHCDFLFAQLGLVELGQVDNSGRLVHGAKITPAGSKLWPAIVGSYPTWQDEHPDIPTSDVVGHSRQAILTGSSTRVRVLEYLLSRPSSSSGVTEIQQALRISMGQVTPLITELSRVGLIAYQPRNTIPEERMFLLKEPAELPKASLSQMSKELEAFVRSLSEADYEAGTVLDLAAIVSLTQSILPDADPHILWNRVRNWLRNANSQDPNFFMKELLPTKEETEARYAQIPQEKQGPIANLLERRARLATDPGYRDEMSDIGTGYIKSKQKVHAAMRLAKHEKKHSHMGDIEWELILLDNLPLEGAFFDSLYQTVLDDTSVTITLKSFRNWMKRLSNLVEVTDVRDENGVLKSFVCWKKSSFKADWVERARCIRPHVDPTIFYPNQSEPQKVQRAKIADAVLTCLGCDVRQACLATALDNGDEGVVRGGLTPEQLRRVTPEQKRTLISITDIS